MQNFPLVPNLKPVSRCDVALARYCHLDLILFLMCYKSLHPTFPLLALEHGKKHSGVLGSGCGFSLDTVPLLLKY